MVGDVYPIIDITSVAETDIGGDLEIESDLIDDDIASVDADVCTDEVINATSSLTVVKENIFDTGFY